MPEPLDQITQVRLTATQMQALRLAAAERDDSIGATVRSIVVAELARLYPDLLGHLVDNDDPR
jgi:hypothetical protein